MHKKDGVYGEKQEEGEKAVIIRTVDQNCYVCAFFKKCIQYADRCPHPVRLFTVNDLAIKRMETSDG